jgi:CRISPR type III-B/RAMP module RAMP protein Cmr6
MPNTTSNTSQPTYYLPPETAELLTDERLRQCKNPGLLLNKYPPQAALQNSTRKNQWLRDTLSHPLIDATLAAHAYRRWLALTTAGAAQHFQATTDWRLAIGLNSATVIEMSLTLHPLYGIPLIPGSALKGLCRNYVTSEKAEHASKRLAEDDALIERIFGSANQSGTVIFFDALPLEGRATLALDIINVHYPDYYSKGKTPSNEQRPNPLLFLTVTDTIFAFALAPSKRQSAEQQDDVRTAIQWLQEALQAYGVGGKTSAGYGYFTPR